VYESGEEEKIVEQNDTNIVKGTISMDCNVRVQESTRIPADIQLGLYKNSGKAHCRI
jgi:hypothetical protein